MYCIKVKKMLNEAKLRGNLFLTVDFLSALEIEELKECGYRIERFKQKFRIYEE